MDQMTNHKPNLLAAWSDDADVTAASANVTAASANVDTEIAVVELAARITKVKY
jgi:hypothetical protein